MSVTTSTRERILVAASELFRRQGFAATGLKSILAASDAPYGSLYHFFPGGKEELGVAVLDAGGNVYRELVEQFFLPGGNVVRATSDFFEGAAVMIAETDYADACPIATIALETASTSEPMRRASAAAFESWLEVLTDRMTEAGIPRRRARELAVELFCAIEGAFLLSQRDAVTRADTDRGQSGDRVSSSGARQGVGEGLDQAHLVRARASRRSPGSTPSLANAAAHAASSLGSASAGHMTWTERLICWWSRPIASQCEIKTSLSPFHSTGSGGARDSPSGRPSAPLPGACASDPYRR